jgi:transposase
MNMSQKELSRVSVLEDLIAERISLKEAATRLNVSYRQTIRISNVYRSKGVFGLIHGLKDKPSNRSLPAKFVENVISIAKEKYKGFGPTLLQEELAKTHEIYIGVETLRLLMKKNNLLPTIRKHKTHRTRRPRKERFGDMLQLDGSSHDWFGNNKKCCLMNLIDIIPFSSYLFVIPFRLPSL